MRRPALAVATAVLLLTAGCLSGGPAAPAGDAPETPTPDEPRGTAPAAGSATPTEDAGSVEYVVRTGDLPDELESVTVEFRVVFVDDPRDLGPCYPDVFAGRYKATPTPLLTPTAGCHWSDTVEVDLTEGGDGHTLTAFAPSSANGHALLVTGVEATHRNGTTVTAVRGVDDLEVFRSPEAPTGTYVVEMNLGAGPDRVHYDYWIGGERVDERD